MKISLFIVLAACAIAGTAAADTQHKPKPQMPAGPILSAPAGIDAPAREREYVSVIEKARTAFKAAKSVDGRRAARVALQIDAHNFMGLSHDAKDWVGTFRAAGTTTDGRKFLSIEIAPGVVIETWDNVFDDRTYDTLIKAYTPIGKIVGDVSIGQPVSFSANLVGGVIGTDEDMVLLPRVIARFSDFKILDDPTARK